VLVYAIYAGTICATPARPCYCPEVSIPKYIQQSLGHTSIQLTLDRYSHWITSIGRHAAERMDEALDESLQLAYC
jgi:integrase